MVNALVEIGEGVVEGYKKLYEARAIDPQEFERRMGEVKHMLRYYLLAREGGDTGKRYVQLDFMLRNWIESEKTFATKFRGVLIRGKRDGVFKRNGIYLRETKTTSKISDETLLASLALDFQLLTYIIAAEIDLGVEIDGCDYNIIRRPDFKITENFTAKIKKEPEHFFHRYEVTFTRDDIELFKDELECILTEFRNWAHDGMYTYRGFGACTGRKWNCDYLPLCGAGRRDLYEVREQLFPELDY
jgi:hypothetical protein